MKKLFLVTLILISSLIILQIDYSLAAFPGNNGKIAFEKDDDIFVMNSDGSGVTNLTNDGLFNNNPNWSSDGTKIVFDRGEFGSTDIFIINADGSGLTRITDHPGSELMPAWSPDGDKIAFISTRDGNAELYVMNADGSDQTRLTNNMSADELPNWSPLGDRIVIHSGSGIITINPDGTNPTNLSPGFSDRDPNWSPDANKIVFHKSDGNDFEVLSMDADGSNRMVLTSSDFFDGQSAWSPDGNKIVFVGDGTGINIMNSDGSDLQFLIDARKPDWQPFVAVGGEMINVDSTALILVGAQMTAAWMIPIIVSAAGIGLLIQAQKTKLKHSSCPSCKLDSDDIFTLGDKTVGNCDNPKCRVSLFYKK